MTEQTVVVNPPEPQQEPQQEPVAPASDVIRLAEKTTQQAGQIEQLSAGLTENQSAVEQVRMQQQDWETRVAAAEQRAQEAERRLSDLQNSEPPVEEEVQESVVEIPVPPAPADSEQTGSKKQKLRGWL